MTVLLKQFSDSRNVGDAFASSMVSALTGASVRAIGEARCDAPNLIAAGSIAHWADANSVLWGCGLINDWIQSPAPPRHVLAVRGRLTRDILTSRNIACGDVLGDPALLLPGFYSASPGGNAVGVVPHYVDRDSDFVRRCAAEGLCVLDVSDSPEIFIAKLTACERVISSSLHGIVIAHAYGIPAAWVEISDSVHGDGFKFFDYYSSAGIDRADVVRIDSRRESLAVMAGACAVPGVLPDRAVLREVLVAAAESLEVAA